MRVVFVPNGWQIWDEIGLYNGPYSSEGEACIVIEKIRSEQKREQPKIESCPYWPRCGCGTQSGPHSCEWQQERRSDQRR